MSEQPLFLGLDSSTQGLKAVLVDADLSLVAGSAVNFDADLPEFETEGGVHHGADGLTVTSPPLMWVAALDLLLDRLQADGAPLVRVVAVSGSGQQHGSVWLKPEALERLHNLAPARALREQLDGVFALTGSPIWMDSSTGEQCRALEAALGGPQAVADLTGSRAYERFTGNQIAKIRAQQPDVYAATGTIGLVSSFMASLLIGDRAPIDTSDGSGMNLMDLRARDWAPAALECTAPGLADRLGPLVPGHTDVGPLHPYYVERAGFSAACRVIAFSGDNPNSLAGLRLQEAGDIAVSLGTSDTVFGSLAQPTPSASEGHIFANPVDPEGYMALICYKNGSLTREQVRDEAAGGSWDRFSRALADTAPGNAGRIGFYIKEPEITPPILQTGVHRFDADGRPADAFPPEADVRAVVEGQFLSMRLHGVHVGLEARSVLATGGASRNAAIIKVMADVFGVPVLTAEIPDSAALGAAYRALHGWQCRQRNTFVPFAEALAGGPSFTRAADPDPAAHAVYNGMLERYAQLETRIVNQ